MGEFHVGDYVRIVVRPDGAVFAGVLQDFTTGPCAYVLLNGYGFPAEDIAAMEPA